MIASIELETRRFLIRPLGGRNSPEAFRRWAANSKLMSPMNLPARSLTSEQIRSYFASFDNQTNFLLGIFERDSNHHVGFWLLETNAVHRTGAIQLLVDPKLHHRGVFIETGLLLLDWMFGRLGLAKLVVLTLPGNASVIHLLESGGWRLEAVLQSEIRRLDGNGRSDQLRYALLAEDWLRLKPTLARFADRVTNRDISATSVEKL